MVNISKLCSVTPLLNLQTSDAVSFIVAILLIEYLLRACTLVRLSR